MKNIISVFLLFSLSILCSYVAKTQQNNSVILADSLPLKTVNNENNENLLTLGKPIEILQGLEISGYYRFMTNYRKLGDAYPHLENNKTNIFVGDDSQIPQLMLNIKGHASKNTEFGTDLFMWTPLTGAGESENIKGLNLGANLFGNFSTPLGNFIVKTGGINWYALSPFTFQTAKGNNRYSLFDRNPWDLNSAQIDSRYALFYDLGAINQEQRWGNQAFQGLILEGNQLPHNFSFNFMYGKTQFDGGLSAIPNNSFGGRLMKTYAKNKNFISINSFNNKSYLDSLTSKSTGFNISTLELTHFINKLKVYAEIGAGRKLETSSYKKWGEAISVKLSYPIAKKFPTEFHFYRISPDVINNSSVFLNSSLQENVQPLTNQQQPVLIAVSSAMLPIGQLSNNRQGIELNTQIDLGKIKNSIGYGNSMELSELSPKITYTHAFNNLALSRFWRWNFPSNVGPYNNLSKIYRSVFETVYITKTDATTGLPLKKKYFNTIELNSKYKTSIFGKELFLFYLGSLNSVQNFAAPFVIFTEKALVRNYNHQFETYLTINSNIVWCNYVSFERIIANYDTETDVVSQRPKNQHGTSIATGFDFSLSRGVQLFVRERWMKYYDSSFAKDKYNGYETTVELKLFF